MTGIELATEVRGLIGRMLAEGMEPAEIAAEMQEQLNIFIDQHNLEFEDLRKDKLAA